MRKIEEIVQELIDTHNTKSPFEICKNLGINVTYADLPDSVSGFIVEILKKKVVVINISMPDDEKLLTCAHELGHILLHEGINYINAHGRDEEIMNLEKEADYISYCLCNE